MLQTSRPEVERLGGPLPNCILNLDDIAQSIPLTYKSSVPSSFLSRNAGKLMQHMPFSIWVNGQDPVDPVTTFIDNFRNLSWMHLVR